MTVSFSLQQNLATQQYFYRLSFNQMVPKFLMDEFNRLLILYFECGLQSFHSSNAAYLSDMRKPIDDDYEMEPKPLRLDQLYPFLVIFGLQIIISIGAFISELVIHRKRIQHVDPVYGV